MNRAQLVALANAIQTVRPDWQQAGIVAQLSILASNWAGSDGALSAHAMTIAASPQARTPAAFNAAPPEPVPQQTQHSQRRTGYTHEPMCHICARSRSACIKQREWEFQRGIPDPHAFETLEDADQHTSRRTA